MARCHQSSHEGGAGSHPGVVRTGEIRSSASACICSLRPLSCEGKPGWDKGLFVEPPNSNSLSCQPQSIPVSQPLLMSSGVCVCMCRCAHVCVCALISRPFPILSILSCPLGPLKGHCHGTGTGNLNGGWGPPCKAGQALGPCACTSPRPVAAGGWVSCLY